MSDGGAVTLYLVRHGVGEAAGGRCVGHHDLPLAAHGRASLARLAAGWPTPRPPRVIASDLARARDSADVLASAWHGDGAPVRTDARLREMHFGDWEGRTWDEIGRADPDALALWMAGWQEARTPHGEGFPDVVGRVAGWLADAVGETRAGGDSSLAVVAHAGSIRALLVHAVGLPRALAFRLRVDHARVTAVRIAGAVDGRVCDGAEVLFLNADRVPADA